MGEEGKVLLICGEEISKNSEVLDFFLRIGQNCHLELTTPTLCTWQIGGWSISWESLVYSTVRGAGHMVPTFQPARALQLFTSFLAGDVGPPTDTSSCTGL